MSENFPGTLPVGLRACRVVTAGAGSEGGFVEVTIDAARGGVTARCLEAAVTQGPLCVGDAVLAAQGADRAWYVLGRLARSTQGLLTVTREGATTVLTVDAGSLAVRAPESVVIEALGAGGRVAVKGPEVRVEAPRASVQGGEVRVDAEGVHTEARRVRTVAGVIEVDAQRVIERARDVYQEVRDQLQVKARRARTVTEDAWTLLSGRLRMRAREDVKVDGEKIYLG